MRASRVFVDSNVLASKTLRDWLFLVQQDSGGMYSTYTSHDVLTEAVRVQRRRHPKLNGDLPAKMQAALRKNMTEVLEDFPGDVVFGGTDPDDHHIHAAALACRADIVLTSNGRDFGDPDALGYEVLTPDEFFVLADDSAPQVIRRVVLTQLEYWQRIEGARPLDEALVAADCGKFAARVRPYILSVGSGFQETSFS